MTARTRTIKIVIRIVNMERIIARIISFSMLDKKIILSKLCTTKNGFGEKVEENKMGVKTFQSNQGQSLYEMEAEINKWLSENPNIEITDVVQSQSCDGLGPHVSHLIVISIFYSKKSK